MVFGVRCVANAPGQGADRAPKIQRATEPFAAPERHFAGLAGCGIDEHLIARDLDHPPARGAEAEDIARLQLVHHLFIELANPGFARACVGGQKHPKQAPVRNGAAVQDCGPLRALACAQGVAQAIPGNARAQRAEGFRRIASGEQVQGLEIGALGQIDEGCGAAHGRKQRVDLPVFQGHHRNDLLGEQIQRIAQVAGGFDLRAAHCLDRGRGCQEIAAIFGVNHTLGNRADMVARAADPLQPRGNRGRGLNLHHQIHRAHIDAELERGGGDDGAQAAGFEQILGLLTGLARKRSMVRAGEFVLDLIVDGGGDPLGEPARIHEYDG